MTSDSGPVSYIQHPADTPLRLVVRPAPAPARAPLPLGLICNTLDAFSAGTLVEIASPRLAPHMSGTGQIVWCRRERDAYQVGVAFYSAQDLYSIRMLEQLCHIEHYRQLLSDDGKPVSRETAAREWIEKFAAHFPTDGL